MRHSAPVLVVIACALLASASLASSGNARGGPLFVVRVSASAPPETTDALQSAGGRLLDRKLRLWRLPAVQAPLATRLLRAGSLSLAVPERRYTTAATQDDLPDPLSSSEWWRTQIDLTGLTPPGPGIPVTVVDSGLDFQHPEFVNRPNTIALNDQEPQPLGGEHGTMVASLIGAPRNGAGVVGIYPEAILRSWDTAKGAGTEITTSEVVSGILAAARAGRGVINLSLGGPRDPAVDAAIDEAIALGSLVVAASGNDGSRTNTLSYPAASPHVTTVAATDQAGAVAGFSSTSPFVDLAAPGADITVASALANGWETSSGTSFSTPLVSGAAAWLWSVRQDLTADQVAEILRRSARDLAPTGRDAASGFGMLDVGAALALAAPVADRFEPNDDIDAVAPGGEANVVNAPPLTTRSKRRATVAARVDRFEDPRDIYRVWIPRASRLTVSATSTSEVGLLLARDSAVSVAAGGVAAPDRLARGAASGSATSLSFRNRAAGRWAYVVVSPVRGSLDATYRLVVGSAPLG